MTTRLTRALALALLAPLLPAEAQVIRVKTLPVAESEQFSFLPSAGMAGASIALADTLLDPFVNPAKAGRLKGTRYFGAPSFFSVSANSGSGTTFPLGAIMRRGSSFAMLGAAIQQIHRPSQGPDFGGAFRAGVVIVQDDVVTPTTRPAQSHRNNYTVAMLGHTLEAQRISVAASALWSGLDAVDGVEQFYERNDWLRQKGEAMDLRFGVVKEWSNGRSLEALLLRNRFGHSHDVGFTDLFWDPQLRRPLTQPRTEHNGERSVTTGLHLEYEHPLRDSSWRVGALATANRISHLLIPSYEIMNGMGTSGRSNAYNLGVGVARSHGPLAFGVDAIYEPISMKTWVPDSVDNRFNFSNARLRGGISRRFTMADPGSSLSVQLGAELYSVHYVMNQDDRVNNVSRVRKETWLERSRTAGMSFRVPGVEVHYHVRTRTGTGRPGVIVSSNVVPVPGADVAIGPWMPPVADANVLGPVRVTWHQFSISIPQR